MGKKKKKLLNLHWVVNSEKFLKTSNLCILCRKYRYGW